MAEEPASGERTESPSAKRRADFRKKGQVAQSREVQTAALFTLLLLFWVFFAPIFWDGTKEMVAVLWRNSGDYAITTSSLMQLGYFLGVSLAMILAPLFLVALLVGFLATFLQIGWLFTTEPLIPDLTKLDPIKGMGRFFSKRSLVEVIKSLLKVGLIGWIAYKTVAGEMDQALLLTEMPLDDTILYLAKTSALVMAKVAAIMIVLAILDYAFVRWEMEEKMKMTKQEQKEEMKETEGDPHIKSKIRSIQQQMARRRMMAAVPTADVVITNPTHIAVAIKYEAGTMDAPLVLAKGQELVAEKIREIARENDIPLVENPPVARLLHSKVEVGQAIPEELFKAVAEILAYVYSLKGRR
ncbi:flagellar biosynthetic protein FlhB [Desulfobulbus propionicus DSM 2032]|uniref:Flagellar biosynthetic protein FlhB n=1 Tax=Desulfobulbus propionicus (strain ATCC 33891 / DSM 2032 / VKM B-1956 / 1pr3) TaxID=577650 RepID=A0A7U3YNA9_DESPD|nr:flagellar biosynthesis protein FlhB [Desulfobulbus propionicus]ADW18383.1 flagellar biosynthetic protein FlhB [Desulfobulbus propionicus DSM 2032]